MAQALIPRKNFCYFFEIINAISDYLDTEAEIQDFQKYIEENHSYKQSGNTLWHSKTYFGGNHTIEEHDDLVEKFSHHLLEAFDGFSVSKEMLRGSSLDTLHSCANELLF